MKRYLKLIWQFLNRRIVLEDPKKCFRAPRLSTRLENHLEDVALKSMADSDDTQVECLTVWTEGEEKCSGHCYHRVGTSSGHKKNLKLNPGDEHRDYVCCKCTHGMCSTVKDSYAKLIRSTAARV